MEWKEEVIREYFRDEDVHTILSLRLPTKPVEDFLAWNYEKSGVFSVRSAYRLANELAAEE
jgi:hypothetical protein